MDLLKLLNTNVINKKDLNLLKPLICCLFMYIGYRNSTRITPLIFSSMDVSVIFYAYFCQMVSKTIEANSFSERFIWFDKLLDVNIKNKTKFFFDICSMFTIVPLRESIVILNDYILLNNLLLAFLLGTL